MRALLATCLLLSGAGPAAADVCFNREFAWRSDAPVEGTKYEAIHQEIRRADGSPLMGAVELVEYRDGKKAWSAQGSQMCSNGIVTCGISFDLTDGDVAGTAYHEFQAGDGIIYLVLPGVWQRVMSAWRSSYSVEPEDGVTGGLILEWYNGFTPDPDWPELPRVVFTYAGCAPE